MSSVTTSTTVWPHVQPVLVDAGRVGAHAGGAGTAARRELAVAGEGAEEVLGTADEQVVVRHVAVVARERRGHRLAVGVTGETGRGVDELLP
ncbi:hypothetical protein GCM10025868_12380 [Angustibacter aerolatus]|uniref:Uncharacterized protein n=1 Tax=Angustibacter aerolatus TaxID=1162965 RepID=A0ABQ6JCS3_9ACTN|nr:hypothetical protein GCM10025868_12380 [Angustibacter aerolatus]